MWWLEALEEHERREVVRALEYMRHSRRKSPDHDRLLALAKIAFIADKAIGYYAEEIKEDGYAIGISTIDEWAREIR